MLRKLLKNHYSTVHLDLFLKDKNYLTRSKYAIASIVTFTRSTLPVPAEEIKPKGSVLKVAKMATHFSEKKTKQNKTKKSTLKKLPRRKVFLRSGDGQKVEAVTVAQKMRHAKDEARIRRFTLDEYLTPRLVQPLPPEWLQSSKQTRGGPTLKKA